VRIHLIILSLICLQGCTDKSKFAGGAGSASPATGITGGRTDGETSLPGSKAGPPAPEPERETCETATSLQTLEQAISFPERLGCRFGQAPNLERDQGHITAAEEQSFDLQLPEGTICGMEIESQSNEKIKYDDFLVFSIDDKVIMASNEQLVEKLSKKNGLYEWDFTKVVGSEIKEFKQKPYCMVKAADCSIPATETKGVISLRVSAKDIAPISAALQGRKTVAITLTSTGDDDETKDCSHSTLDMSVKVTYLKK
jgi:hypothetical protein